jgi:hypothetical protein
MAQMLIKCAIAFALGVATKMRKCIYAKVNTFLQKKTQLIFRALQNRSKKVLCTLVDQQIHLRSLVVQRRRLCTLVAFANFSSICAL